MFFLQPLNIKKQRKILFKWQRSISFTSIYLLTIQIGQKLYLNLTFNPMLINLSCFYNFKYNQLQMNPSNMRIPVFSQILQHKQIHQAHLKKLENIKQHRQTQLGIDLNRSKFIDFVRESKNKTFANRFNNHFQQINKQNVRFVKKLQKAKTAIKFSSTRSCHNQQTSLNNKSCMSIPKNQNLSRSRSIRQKTIETQKQNLRLLLRLKTTESSVNNNKFKNDFAKAQKIKQRLMKYSCKQNGQGNKIVLLKSQRYIDIKSSYLSSKSREKSKSEYNTLQPKKITTATFYKREDIVKNKVQNQKFAANHNLKRLSNFKNKAISSRLVHDDNIKVQSLKQTLQTLQQQKQGQQSASLFFPTEVTKKSYSNLPEIGLIKGNLGLSQNEAENNSKTKLNTFRQIQQKERFKNQIKMHQKISSNRKQKASKDSRVIYLSRKSAKK